ncbi:MAG TPA: hypothetical protein VIL85_05370 [Thermomicrobiales bacterium]|jgi:hypothetical protein
MDERARQRAGVAWALADLEGLLARGVIDEQGYATLRRDYETRLQHLDVALSGAVLANMPVQATLPLTGQHGTPGTGWQGPRTDIPAAHQPSLVSDAPLDVMPNLTAAMPITASFTEPGPSVASASVAPRARAGEVTGLWINLTLFLGAFFIVMASLIFVISSWRFLGAGAKAAIMAVFTGAFIGGGLVCLRVPRVRPAGQTFLGIGAVLLPLDIIGAYNFFLRDQGVSGATTWTFGAAICALFYGALALRQVGRVYAVMALIAVVMAWGGAIVAFNVPEPWIGPAFLLLPLLLLLAGRLSERTGRGRATFGAFPAWMAQLLIPLGGLFTVAAGVFADERQPPVAALALVLVFYGLAAATQGQPLLRGFQVGGAALAGASLIVALGWLGHLSMLGYAATTLGGVWLSLVVGLLLGRGGEPWRWGALAALGVGWLQFGLLLLPWGYFVADGNSAYWSLIFGGALAFAALNLWGLRQPWHLYPVAIAGAVTLFHLLRIGSSPGVYGYAWAYTLAALGPVTVLQPLRRQGAPRIWDKQLVVINQGLAVAAIAIALVAGNRFQTTAILLLFALAGGAIAATERRPELLVIPNLWGIGLIAATVGLAGAGPRWAPSFYAGTGLIIALALQGWRGVPTTRRTDWFMAQRWCAGLWAVSGPVLGGWFLAEAAAAFLASGELRELVLDSAYGPVGLAVSLCGAALAADAIMTLRRPTGYGASAVIATAVLMGIARITPNNPQAYAVPLGIYLFALSVYVAYERDLGPIRMPAANGLLAGSVAVILGTTFAQSLLHPWRYIFLGLLEGLILLGLTVFLRRRYGVALCVLFISLLTLRAVFDAARSLPNWAVIGLLGLLLLVAAVVILLRRDRLEAWWGSAATRWGRLS